MYYSKHPFLKVGLPFLSAMVFGTFFLVDLRQARYEPKNRIETHKLEEKRTIKSLEEELKEWEEKHRRKLEETSGDYVMKPVRQAE